MNPIDMTPMTAEFEDLWMAAGRHLQSCVEGGLNTWLRVHRSPPFLEHLSFRLGNQLFFIFLVDIDRVVTSPGSLRSLQHVTQACGGIPCLMPMERTPGSKEWQPVQSGWGLIHAVTHEAIDPPSLVTDEAIVMTDWELQDFAVNVVRKNLEDAGHALMSWNADPDVSPNVWFIGASGRPEWVVVRAARYPARDASRPPNLSCLNLSHNGQPSIGYFASVTFVNAEDPFDPMAATTGNYLPLLRGQGTIVRFSGLEPVNLN